MGGEEEEIIGELMNYFLVLSETLKCIVWNHMKYFMSLITLYKKSY